MCDMYGKPVLTDRGKTHGPAMRSRFFLMHIETDADGVSHLELDQWQAARRGSPECRQAKIDTAADFRDKFNAIIREYRPRQVVSDWSRFSISKDGPLLYHCRRCGRIGTLAPDTTSCERCGTVISGDSSIILNEDGFLTLADRHESACTDALIDFSFWFWSSLSGGLAWYLCQDADNLDDPRREIMFAQSDSLLVTAINARLPDFKGYELVRDLKPGMVLDAVKCAWAGDFGEVPALNDNPGFASWDPRTHFVDRYRKCPNCLASLPLRERVCRTCGTRMFDP